MKMTRPGGTAATAGRGRGRSRGVTVAAVAVLIGASGSLGIGSAATAAAAVTVAADGSGDYTKIQEAIDAAPPAEALTITVKSGTYYEKVTVPASKGPITLVGTSAPSSTVIEYDAAHGSEKPGGGTWGTSGSASVTVESDDFTAKNITIVNTFDEEKNSSISDRQAVALLAKGDRTYFENVRFLGNQDTLYLNGGRAYLHGCYVEGDVDFIFGKSTAVFDGCTIHSLARSSGTVTAASTPGSSQQGFLFVRSTLEGEAAAGTVRLGRPWHPGGDKSVKPQVLFRDSKLGAHIASDPWTDMSGFSWKDARFAEFNNSGEGSGTAGPDRPHLTAAKAAGMTVETYLGDWSPIPRAGK